MERISDFYEEHVKQNFSNFMRITINGEYVKKIENFVGELIKRKQQESHHKNDNSQEIKRFTTGFLGEAALEQLLNFPIIDWTIDDSKLYHHPDIPGFELGVKTVEYGKFPIIFKQNSYPQVICIRRDNDIYICGIATADVLNKYQCDDLIVDPKLRARGTKTGFYGFEYLTPIKSVEDIAQFSRK